MEEIKKQAIIESGKVFFRTIIIPNHIKQLQKLKLSDFNINPFLINYLAAFLCGDTTPQSLAKALLYPRILGTSINTSFSQNIQTFISSLEEVIGCASGIEGIDIEFIDALDGRRKYCQLKAGPESVNDNEATTILHNFKHLIGKTRLDQLPFNIDDLIVGILFGENINLSTNYQIIDTHYPVYCGIHFWERITGDKDFYYRLVKAFGEVIEEEDFDGSQMINMKVDELAQEIIGE